MSLLPDLCLESMTMRRGRLSTQAGAAWDPDGGAGVRTEGPRVCALHPRPVSEPLRQATLAASLGGPQNFSNILAVTIFHSVCEK